MLTLIPYRLNSSNSVTPSLQNTPSTTEQAQHYTQNDNYTPSSPLFGMPKGRRSLSLEKIGSAQKKRGKPESESSSSTGERGRTQKRATPSENHKRERTTSSLREIKNTYPQLSSFEHAKRWLFNKGNPKSKRGKSSDGPMSYISRKYSQEDAKKLMDWNRRYYDARAVHAVIDDATMEITWPLDENGKSLNPATKRKTTAKITRAQKREGAVYNQETGRLVYPKGSDRKSINPEAKSKTEAKALAYGAVYDEEAEKYIYPKGPDGKSINPEAKKNRDERALILTTLKMVKDIPLASGVKPEQAIDELKNTYQKLVKTKGKAQTWNQSLRKTKFNPPTIEKGNFPPPVSPHIPSMTDPVYHQQALGHQTPLNTFGTYTEAEAYPSFETSNTNPQYHQQQHGVPTYQGPVGSQTYAVPSTPYNQYPQQRGGYGREVITAAPLQSTSTYYYTPSSQGHINSATGEGLQGTGYGGSSQYYNTQTSSSSHTTPFQGDSSYTTEQSQWPTYNSANYENEPSMHSSSVLEQSQHRSRHPQK